MERRLQLMNDIKIYPHFKVECSFNSYRNKHTFLEAKI